MPKIFYKLCCGSNAIKSKSRKKEIKKKGKGLSKLPCDAINLLFVRAMLWHFCLLSDDLWCFFVMCFSVFVYVAEIWLL